MIIILQGQRNNKIENHNQTHFLYYTYTTAVHYLLLLLLLLFNYCTHYYTVVFTIFNYYLFILYLYYLFIYSIYRQIYIDTVHKPVYTLLQLFFFKYTYIYIYRYKNNLHFRINYLEQ